MNCTKLKLLSLSLWGTGIVLGFLNLATFFPTQAQTAAQTKTQAQSSLSSTPIDLSVTPPTTYLTVRPGQKVTHTVTLEQRGSLPLVMTPSVVDFGSDGSTGQPRLSETSTFPYLSLTIPGADIVNSGAAATSHPPNSFHLNPGQKKNLVFTIDVPQTAVEKEYPQTLLFRAQPNDSFTIGDDQSGTAVSGVVGSNLIILISSSERDRGNLTLAGISARQWVDSFSQLTFKLLAHNDGFNATTASGSAVITDWRGQQVAEFDIYPDMVLAGSDRNLRTVPRTANQTGEVGQDSESLGLDPTSIDPTTVTPNFTYKNWFLLGPYTITAQLHRSGQEPTIGSTLSLTVVALPYTLLILVLLGLGMFFGYNYWVKNHHHTREEIENAP